MRTYGASLWNIILKEWGLPTNLETMMLSSCLKITKLRNDDLFFSFYSIFNSYGLKIGLILYFYQTLIIHYKFTKIRTFLIKWNKKTTNCTKGKSQETQRRSQKTQRGKFPSLSRNTRKWDKKITIPLSPFKSPFFQM